MSKKYFCPASPARKHFALSELPDSEVADLLTQMDMAEISTTMGISRDESERGGELFDNITSCVSPDEAELFSEIVSVMSSTIPYGQAILLLALYAITVEDRVRTALMC